MCVFAHVYIFTLFRLKLNKCISGRYIVPVKSSLFFFTSPHDSKVTI